MVAFFMKRKQVLILFTFSVSITQTLRFAEAADCLESLQNITCTCTSNSLTCTGISDGTTDIVSAVSLLSSNYTYGRTECINITINELFLNSSTSFQEVNAQNLTLGSGLTSLPENLFHGLNESLLNLNLQNNKLSVVPTKSLHILGRLQELDLSNNTIKNLQTNDFVGMPLLILLNLNRNDIGTLEDETFSELNNLEILLLEFNNLLEIEDETFQGLGNLQVLSLAGNDLQYLDPDPFMPLTSLQTLVLNHNELSSLSSINIESSSLKKFSAQYCALKGPIEMHHFSDTPNLTFLDLSHNNLSEVKTMALSALSHLESLDLSNNAIKRLNKNAFSSLSSLMRLNLENNNMEVATTSALNGLTNLTYLNLDNNKLIALLCEYTADLHSLKELSIQNNRLRKITAGSLNYSGSLKQLRMKSNELECDCDLSSFSNFLRSNPSLSASDIDSVKCSTPGALQGKRVIDVDFVSMACENSSSCISPSLQGSGSPTESEEITTVTSMYAGLVPAVIELHNATYINQKLCVEWGVQGNESKDYKCVLSFTYLSTKKEKKHDFIRLKCPSLNGERSNQCETPLEVDEVYDICVKILYFGENVGESCSKMYEFLTVLEVEPTTALTSGIGNHTSEGISETSTEIVLPTTEQIIVSDLNSSTSFTNATTAIVLFTTERKPTTNSTADTTVNFSDTTNATVPSTTERKPTTNSTADLTSDTTVSFSDTTNATIPFTTERKPTANSTADLTSDTSTNFSDTTIAIILPITERKPTTDSTPDLTHYTSRNVSDTTTEIISSTALTDQSTSSTSDLYSSTGTKVSNATTEKPLSSEFASTFSYEAEKVTFDPKSTPVEPFNFTLFRISEKSPNSVYIEWTVNRNEPSSECFLKLELSENNSTVELKRFNCSNSSFLVTNMEKHFTYEICLSGFAKQREVELCETFSLLPDGSSSSQRATETYTFSIAVLLGLLILVICIVLLIVLKSTLRKRRIANQYNVSKEEEKVNIRKESSVSRSDRETRVRYSYTRTEGTENI